MLGTTKPFTLNNAWVNLLTQARADGYAGNAIVKSGIFLNFNATVTYVHFTSDGGTNPATAADGVPVSSDAANAPSASLSLAGADIGLIWIHTAGNLTLKYAIQG